MFIPTNPQRSIFSVEHILGPQKAQRLEKSWAKPFRDQVLPLIREDQFAQMYCQDNGAPNKSVRTMVALHLLKDQYDFTDEETIQMFEWNNQWHYALVAPTKPRQSPRFNAWTRQVASRRSSTRTRGSSAPKISKRPRPSGWIWWVRSRAVRKRRTFCICTTLSSMRPEGSSAAHQDSRPCKSRPKPVLSPAEGREQRIKPSIISSTARSARSAS